MRPEVSATIPKAMVTVKAMVVAAEAVGVMKATIDHQQLKATGTAVSIHQMNSAARRQ